MVISYRNSATRLVEGTFQGLTNTIGVQPSTWQLEPNDLRQENLEHGSVSYEELGRET